MKRRVGRYIVFDAFARGGMATVHLGRLVADRGFSRLVAIKMAAWGEGGSRGLNARALEEEARIASRIRHPNVVQPLDFLVDGDDLLIVMEYVHGVSLSRLALNAAGAAVPPVLAAAILADVLSGLHAAHEAVDERGRLLGLVHRDVSPQNVLVGADGVARLVDFGIAKVMRATEHTETGIVKGKLSYMPPEQLRGLPVTRQADIFAAGAVLAETLSGMGPDADEDASDPTGWLRTATGKISEKGLRDVVVAATKPDPRDRYGTALEMASALSAAIVPARADAVAEYVTSLVGDDLEIRSELVRSVEADPLADLDAIDDTTATPHMLSRPPSAPTPPSLAPPVLPLGERPTMPPPRRALNPARRVLLFMTGASIALVCAAAWARFLRPHPETELDPRPSAEVDVDAQAPTRSPPLPTAVVSSAPPTTAVVVASRAPVASAPPPGPAPVKSRPPRARASGHTSPDCTPPFRIDAEGKKHYRPECLE